MDSDHPIAARNAGEPTLPSGTRFTFAMWNGFKLESSDPTFGFRPFLAPRAADCGDGRCRGASHPAQGYGHPA